MNKILKQISEIGIVPVIAINDVDKAVPLAKALVAGGIECAEVTFRTACAEEAIKKIKKEVPEMLVGAGTVLTCEQLDRAVKAGSNFIVSPGFNRKVVEYAISKGVLIAPGTATPGEMEQAMELGLEVVKFFPAEQNGGIAKIKAVCGPYKNLMFMPTGGINAGNLKDYIMFDKILACGGSWMVNSKLIDAGNFEEITRLTKEAVNVMLGFEIAHLGINCANEKEALKTANMFGAMFNVDINVGNSSIFIGNNDIEIMKSQYLGKNGHIGIKTNSLFRAEAYFKKKGFEFNEESRKPKAIYFKDEIAGFAVHLVQR